MIENLNSAFLFSSHYGKITEINFYQCVGKEKFSNTSNQIILNPIFPCLTISAISGCFHNFLIKSVNRFSPAHSVIYPEQ